MLLAKHGASLFRNNNATPLGILCIKALQFHLLKGKSYGK